MRETQQMGVFQQPASPETSVNKSGKTEKVLEMPSR
jgi:hypothetical protein